MKEKATHTITKAISILVHSTEWTKTIEYRNDWVHDQPPLIKDLGIVYKRKNRWEKSKTGKGMVLFGGSGDKPEYSADDLINFIKSAMFQFSMVLDSVINFYIDLLKPKGIRFEKRDDNSDIL